MRDGTVLLTRRQGSPSVAMGGGRRLAATALESGRRQCGPAGGQTASVSGRVR